MPEAKSSRDVLAQVMDEGKKRMIPLLAEMMKRDAIAEVPPDEERRQFWAPAITDEQEQQMWQQEMTTRGVSPEMANDPEQAQKYLDQMVDIGLKIASQKYPGRFDMMTGEGRNTQAQQALWAWRHAQAGSPKPLTEEPDVSP